MAGLGALGVVGGGLAVQLLGGGVRRALAVGGLEVDPGRHPDDGAHPVLAHLLDHPRGVRELVRVEAPGVVLRLPGGVDHDRVQRQPVLAVAAPVVLDVVLVLVDVAALPVPVGPLGHQRGHPGQAQQCAQVARRGLARGTGGGERARPRRGLRSRPRPPSGRTRRQARRSRARRPSRPTRAATAPARSRPAGCRRSPGSPRGSQAPCSGGRRRAGRSGRAGRSRGRGGRRARSAARPRSSSQRDADPQWRVPGCGSSTVALGIELDQHPRSGEAPVQRELGGRCGVRGLGGSPRSSCGITPSVSVIS